MKAKPLFLILLKLVLAVACIAFVWSNIPVRDVLQLIASAQPGWILASLGVFILSKIISAIRLQIFFTHSNVHLPIKGNLELYWLGMFYNQFLPGGVGGDAYKTYLISRGTGKSITAMAKIILLDRISGITALVALLLMTSIFIVNLKWLVWLILAAIGLYMLYFILLNKVYRDVSPSAVTELYSWLVQLAQFVAAFCLLQALHVTHNFVPYLALFLVSSVASVVPFTLGGAGTRELAFLFGANWLQLNKQVAVSTGTLFYLISLFASLWGLIYVFKPPILFPKSVSANLTN